MKVLLLTKQRQIHQMAADLVRGFFPDAVVAHEQPNLDGIDVLLSFFGPCVVPAEELAKVKLAINVHPGSPSYPGFACYNQALYDGVRDYGVTVHHMEPKVDSGQIVGMHHVAAFTWDSVIDLQRRCEAVALGCLPNLLLGIYYKAPVLFDKEHPAYKTNAWAWTREASTEKDFRELAYIRVGMDDTEIERRRRAIEYPGKPGLVWEPGTIDLSKVEKSDEGRVRVEIV